MKLLYILPSFQHPAMRGSTRHYYFLRELAKRHSITLLVLCKARPNAAARSEISRYVKQLYTFETTAAPDSINPHSVGQWGRIRNRFQQLLRTQSAVAEMKRTVDSLMRSESFDLILFHGKEAFPAIKDCKNVPVVIDFCDTSAPRLRQGLLYGGASGLPWRLLRYWRSNYFELGLLNKTRHLAFISPRDLRAVGRPDDQYRIIPNGVDSQYWTRKAPEYNPNGIVFTGVMDYPPNADAALFLINKILPQIRRQVPQVEVVIAGRNPLPELIQAARKDPKIIVTGFVEDIRPYLEKASVYLAPLRFASGMQNKLLEALSMEVPVVTTPVAAAGLCLEGTGQPPPVIEAEGEDSLANSVIRLLNGQEDRVSVVSRGRHFIEEHFDWTRAALLLEKMCLDAAGPVRSSTEHNRKAGRRGRPQSATISA